MMTINDDFRNQVRDALIADRQNYEGTDRNFAVGRWDIAPAAWSQIKKGKIVHTIGDKKWITIGKELNVGLHQGNWVTAKTEVFTHIEEEVLFCKNNAAAKVFVDDCALGKTWTAKYLSKTVMNCFYVDCSQAKSRLQFIKALAKAVAMEQTGTYCDIKDNIKYYLKITTKPIVILDEAGDLDYQAFLEIKEFWNATEGSCGWYMMGADGLRAKIERGIKNKTVGFKEIFSRFSNKYSSVVPTSRQEKIVFYRNLVRTVLEVNMKNKSLIDEIANKCLSNDGDDFSGILRRAQMLLNLYRENGAEI
ncbi:MAG: ATP-binding protein [Bacteroidetes bacterium]|nr:ATP-binding protein [Bacteroidota bacterium]